MMNESLIKWAVTLIRTSRIISDLEKDGFIEVSRYEQTYQLICTMRHCRKRDRLTITANLQEIVLKKNGIIKKKISIK